MFAASPFRHDKARRTGAAVVTRTLPVILFGVALLAAGCMRTDAPASTPLPTKEKTIGRVQQQLQKADEETAKRREAIDAAGK